MHFYTKTQKKGVVTSLGRGYHKNSTEYVPDGARVCDTEIRYGQGGFFSASPETPPETLGF